MTSEITPKIAIEALKSHAIEGKSAEMAAYHKAKRVYLGVSNPEIDALCRDWRADIDLNARIALAQGLWASDIHEARVAAAKLFVQARLRPDDIAAWNMIVAWVPDFDGWAIADHVATAGQKRLIADPSRLDEVEQWAKSEHMWTKRAALVFTLPWTKMNNPKPADLETRERILGWAAEYVEDSQWFIQKSVSWWLRELSKHDPARTIAFIDAHGDKMKPSLRKDAVRMIKS